MQISSHVIPWTQARKTVNQSINQLFSIDFEENWFKVKQLCNSNAQEKETKSPPVIPCVFAFFLEQYIG